MAKNKISEATTAELTETAIKTPAKKNNSKSGVLKKNIVETAKTIAAATLDKPKSSDAKPKKSAPKKTVEKTKANVIKEKTVEAIKDNHKNSKTAEAKTIVKQDNIEQKEVQAVAKKPTPKAPVIAAKPAQKTEQVDKKPKPTVRYSDADLESFKLRINDVRKEAIDELRMLRERLVDLTNYDFAEESMIYSMHMAEQGSEAFEKEKTYAQIQRINEYIKKLDDALLRIKEGTYGICRVCGCLIAKERLLAVPITTLSAAYKIHKKCPEDGMDRIEPLQN